MLLAVEESYLYQILQSESYLIPLLIHNLDLVPLDKSLAPEDNVLKVTLCVQLFKHALKIVSVALIYHVLLPNKIVLLESVPQVNIIVGMENVFLKLNNVLPELHALKLPQ
jgi:hypothetical protein